MKLLIALTAMLFLGGCITTDDSFKNFARTAFDGKSITLEQSDKGGLKGTLHLGLPQSNK